MSERGDHRLDRVSAPGQNGGHRAPAPPEADLGFLDYLLPIRRHWWVIALCAGIALAAAWWSMRSDAPHFTAEALLQARAQPESQIGSLRQTEPVDVGAQIEIMRSRAITAVVVDSLDLRLQVHSDRVRRTRLLPTVEIEPDAPNGVYVLARSGPVVELRRPDEEAVLAVAEIDKTWIRGPGFRLWLGNDPSFVEPVTISLTDRDRAIERLSRQIRIEPGRGVGLMRIRYTSTDPALAAGVVNTMATAYVQFTALRGRQSAGRTRDFLSRQLTQLADSLKRAQDAMLEFQAREGLFSPATESGALSAALLQAENTDRELRFQRSLLNSVVASVAADSGGVNGMERIMVLGQDVLPGGTTLYNQLQELEADRSRLTASRFGYTESGPSVQVIDSLIANTRTRIASVAQQSQEILDARIQENQRRLGELRAQAGSLPQ
ncbi:MAG: hypothetical protein P8177_14520, partial [Gemmatimonadota bacterium]